MSKYTVKSLSGANNLHVSRKDKNALTLTIGEKDVTVLTEDLAALVRAELPEDRGAEMFSEIVEQEIKSGYARVIVEAEKDIKKGEQVCFKININRYLNKSGETTGVRTTPSGIIY